MKRITHIIICLISTCLFFSCSQDEILIPIDDSKDINDIVMEELEVKPSESLPEDQTLITQIIGEWKQNWTEGFVGDTARSVFCGHPYSWQFKKNKTGTVLFETSNNPFKWEIKDGYLALKYENDTSIYAIQELTNSRLKVANSFTFYGEVVKTQFSRE